MRSCNLKIMPLSMEELQVPSSFIKIEVFSLAFHLLKLH